MMPTTSYKMQNNLPDQITITDYLFHRLRQLKVKTIFGLPGEFNMPLLDKIYRIPDMRWAGNANELNAAYAADGYSRIKRLGCLVTTFGVGELSAINGVAGSFAEHVGLLHVVGMPPTSAQTKQLLLHHTLGNGDYNVFYRMANDVTCHTGLVADSDLCCMEVDKCVEMAWREQKPAYLGIPVNQVDLTVDSVRLDTPLNLESEPNNQEIENDVVKTILKKLYTCENPAIIVDACVIRHDLVEETKQFRQMTNFPTFVTPMGKGAVDESLSNFGGVFTGSLSSPSVREVVDFADFIIVIGSLLAEFSTPTFHFFYKTKNYALIHSSSVKLKNATYPDIHIKHLMQVLLSRLDTSKISCTFRNTPPINVSRPKLSGNQLLKQEWVWNELSHWFQQGDIIITEIGTSAFGINQTRFPPRTKGISQALWASSGYSVGACLGASFAAQELQEENPGDASLQHRVLLFVGDGAFQITMQEISTMIRWKLTPYIFLLNNQGYSVDRFLHHRSKASYYDVQPWHYLKFFDAFGADDYETRKIVTLGDLRDVMNDKHFCKDDKIRMLEIMLPSTDVPQVLVESWMREKEEQNKVHESPQFFETPDSVELTDATDEPTPKRSRLNDVASI
ncbi:branched-chain-2-oxoacid decarboxylase THI3 KNAG_0A05900 [Huiozyma naganishii CBS 8797]|uniref:Pyruvate decarboxylase n=1 Tax=Huiozyma naganishii (strain ATCC MYA-139 / BCRC 22969 / CBS 8797 / KCTC 17520 / NBRC 10181 / NCYC 3082 / Yp74L-3) TaxID=1071383 RepID=J7RFB7_HUIN7|nr:hypothetical protein KNAG_0A05900 [Kazachstania naganishii CBS 8797]CCK68253.1 hypothetical protein KNAG_0A05900 [Kazachstania naganishii CBS 8797]